MALDLVAVLVEGPPGHEQWWEHEDDPERTETHRLPEHHQDERDDAVAEMVRAARDQQAPDLGAHRDTLGEPDDHGDEQQVGKRLRDIGDRIGRPTARAISTDP